MRKKHLLFLIVVLLFALTIAIACNADLLKLKWHICKYQNTIEELPKDITLTIYYFPPQIFLMRPLTVEDLLKSDMTEKIVINSDELTKNMATLKKLSVNELEVSYDDRMYINARFYYVFETNNGKILEVVLQQFVGDDVAFGAHVNGISVKKNTVLYEIVIPYLPEKYKQDVGIYAERGLE